MRDRNVKREPVPVGDGLNVLHMRKPQEFLSAYSRFDPKREFSAQDWKYIEGQGKPYLLKPVGIISGYEMLFAKELVGDPVLSYIFTTFLSSKGQNPPRVSFQEDDVLASVIEKTTHPPRNVQSDAYRKGIIENGFFMKQLGGKVNLDVRDDQLEYLLDIEGEVINPQTFVGVYCLARNKRIEDFIDLYGSVDGFFHLSSKEDLFEEITCALEAREENIRRSVNDLEQRFKNGNILDFAQQAAYARMLLGDSWNTYFTVSEEMWQEMHTALSDIHKNGNLIRFLDLSFFMTILGAQKVWLDDDRMLHIQLEEVKEQTIDMPKTRRF